MSGVAVYAQRMAVLPAALAALELHPEVCLSLTWPRSSAWA